MTAPDPSAPGRPDSAGHRDFPVEVGFAIEAFLEAVERRDRAEALRILESEPRVVRMSIPIRAILGLEDEVRRRVERDPGYVRMRTGGPGADPLLWLCYSPFHGESPERDAALEATARVLLEAGADPNTRDAHFNVPALYAVTGLNDAPRIAKLLLDAGAEPNDGESLFHAAERFHEASLELLLEHGADPNHVGDWGNTALCFLLRWHDLATEPTVHRGVVWLLDHGADPDVRSGREEETALHVAARRRQRPEVVRLLLDRGADVHARRADGRTPWLLARRAGADEVAALLEERGAEPEPLSPVDELVRACESGDAGSLRSDLAGDLAADLGPADRRLLPEAASEGRFEVVEAYLAAGFPVDGVDEMGASALHHAAIRGRADLVRALAARGADLELRDPQHQATPLGWATFGADHVRDAGGDYPATVAALLEAGADKDAGG